jgi:hypothetical protein
MGVVAPQADPLAWRPLVGRIGVEVLTVLVLGRQFLEVGAVFAETFGDADVGLEQGGVEGPVQRFDVGVAPLDVVVAG